MFEFDRKSLNKPYLINPLDNETFTYGNLFLNSDILSQKVLKNLPQESYVGIISKNTFFISCFVVSCWRNNLVPSIIPPTLNYNDYEELFKSLSFSGVVSDEKKYEKLQSVLIYSFTKFNRNLNKLPNKISFQINTSSYAVVLFSSGTTNKQKAIPLSFENIFSNIESFERSILSPKYNAFLCVSPVWHAHGLYNSLITAFFKKKYVYTAGILNIFNAVKLLEFMSQYSGIIFHLTPSMIPILISASKRLEKNKIPKFEKVICGTSFLDVKSKIKFEEIFKTPLIQQYGMTEALFIAVNDLPSKKPTSVGKPIDIVDLKITDYSTSLKKKIGKIKIKSPSLFKGYLNHKFDLMDSENYMYTGDLGYNDSDGYLFIVDRDKDVIKKGGLTISSSFINSVVSDFGNIDEVFTTSYVDESAGEEIFTFFTSKIKINISELKGFMSKKISPKLLPQKFFQLEKLPKNDIQKVDRKKILSLLNK